MSRDPDRERATGRAGERGAEPGPESGAAHAQESARAAEPGASRGSGRTPAGLSARDLGLPESVPCPFCDSRETELHSAFGSALSVVTYWCRGCHTAFEWIKR